MRRWVLLGDFSDGSMCKLRKGLFLRRWGNYVHELLGGVLQPPRGE